MSTRATVDDDALEATSELVLALCNLVRQANAHEDDHPVVHSAARSVFEAIEAAVPPIALNFVGPAILRGKAAIPLDVEVYRRGQTVGAALQKLDVQQLRFDGVPSVGTLIELAQALTAATHGQIRKPPRLSGVAFQKLVLFGDGDARDEANIDAFVGEQTRRAIVEADAVITRNESRWPWRAARAPLVRLERCMSFSVAATMRTFDFFPGVATRGRRVLSAAFTTAAVLERLGVDDHGRRAAAHAALVLGCHGFDDRGGTPIEEAARVSMGALVKSRMGDSDPHALRTCALVRGIERSHKGNAHPSVLPLLRIAYELELRRAPAGVPFELTRLDLWTWLADAIADGRAHAGWGRAVIEALGVVPPGAHVMADGRLAAVASTARADAPLRPPVIVNGELQAPQTVVQPYSPLAMTPWAK